MNRTLIIGALGQDASYMIELLESKGHEVYGVVRNDTQLGRIKRAKTFPANLLDKNTLRRIINQARPEVIYNFAGVSNVFNPYENLDDILDLNTRLPQNILETIYATDRSIKFFQASSCLVFGKDESGFQNEQTSPNPIYPYGASKLYADYLVKMYRELGLFACSAIFFNHESPRRGEHFFSKRITNAAKRKEKIKVGNLSAVRDYGYAGDFVQAAYLMMNADKPEDYVIGTGNLITMEAFAEKAFEFAGLDYLDYVEMDDALVRKQDTNVLRADITKIKTELGWEPKHTVDDLIRIMMTND